METPDYDQVWTEVYGDLQEHGPVHRHLTRMVAKELAGLDYTSVLDVGCGPGHNHELLCHGHNVSRFGGVDISSVAVQQARQRFDGEFEVLDVQEAPLKGVWDLVYCSLILEHLPEDRAALANIRPAVGRWLLATSIAGDFDRYRRWDERMGHVRNYAVGELEEKCEAAGFRVIKSTYWGWPFYSPIARSLQNYSSVGTGDYGLVARIIASLSYAAFALNSRRRGDVVIVLAEPDTVTRSGTP